jgi:hypothetical protein
MAAKKTQQAAAAAKPARLLMHPSANIQRFERRQHQAIQYMVRVRALMLSARDHLKACDGADADEDLLALLEMAVESAMDSIEEMPPLSVLTEDEGGAA